MKKTFYFLVLLTFTFSLGQSSNVDVAPQQLYPFLYDLRLPVPLPQFQHLSEKELYYKKSKLDGDAYDANLTLKFKNNCVFKGRVESNYGAHEKTVSPYDGEMIFSNGDRFQGKFYKGYPVEGKYFFVNGTQAILQSTQRVDCCNFRGNGSSARVSYPNGDELVFFGTKFQYKAVSGLEVHSDLNADATLQGPTYYRTPEGYAFEGSLNQSVPVGNWSMKDRWGTYDLYFYTQGISGYVPTAKGDWYKIDRGVVNQPVRYLAPYTFCLKGDCQNGTATYTITKDPMYSSAVFISGEFKSGQAVGDFTAEGEDLENRHFTITGPLKNYLFHGKGSFFLTDEKVIFTGDFEAGKPVNGNLAVKDKLIEVKRFENQKFFGKQIFTRSNQYTPNSRYYEGEFNSFGQISGKGTVYFETGYTLEATDWNNGKSSTCTFTRLDTYSENDFYCNVYEGSYFRSLGNQRELDYYAAKRAQEDQARQQEIVNQTQYETQCNKCEGSGVVKIQCPMCKGAGYRKDQVTYDRHTGTTGGPPTCSHCGGSGRYVVMSCTSCSGKGYVKK